MANIHAPQLNTSTAPQEEAFLPEYFYLDTLFAQPTTVSQKLIQAAQEKLNEIIQQHKAKLTCQSFTAQNVLSIHYDDHYDPAYDPKKKNLVIFLVRSDKTGDHFESITLENPFLKTKEYQLLKVLQKLYQQSTPPTASLTTHKIVDLTHLVPYGYSKAQKYTTQTVAQGVYKDLHPEDPVYTDFSKTFHAFLDIFGKWGIPLISDPFAIVRNFFIIFFIDMLNAISRIFQGVLYIPQGAFWLRSAIRCLEKSLPNADTRGSVMSGCDAAGGISSIIEGFLWITLGSLTLAGSAVAAETITFILFNLLFPISFAILIVKGIVGLVEAVSFKHKMKRFLDNIQSLSPEEQIQRITDFFKDQILLSELEIEKITAKINANKKIADEDKAEKIREAIEKKAKRKILRFERRTSEDFVKLVKERFVDSSEALTPKQAPSLHIYAKEANNKAIFKNIAYITIGILGEIGSVISNFTVTGDVVMWMALNAIYLIFLDLGRTFDYFFTWQLTNDRRKKVGLLPVVEPIALTSGQVKNLKSMMKQLKTTLSTPKSLTSKQTKNLNSLMGKLKETVLSPTTEKIDLHFDFPKPLYDGLEEYAH